MNVEVVLDRARLVGSWEALVLVLFGIFIDYQQLPPARQNPSAITSASPRYNLLRQRLKYDFVGN